MHLDSNLISVRDLSERDIPFILNYWFHSPPGFIEGRAVDLTKLPTEADMEKALQEKVHENKKLPSSKLNALVIVYDGQSVGIHTLNPLQEGDHGVFHAHVWYPEFRRRGLGFSSYPKACGVFMDRFNLNRILFKTPIQNVGAIRVKEKLGIRCVGEERIGFGIIKNDTLAKVFELRRDEIENLLTS